MSTDVTRRLGEQLLARPNATLGELRALIKTAQDDAALARKQKRLRVLVDELAFAVRLTERSKLLADVKRLAEAILKEIDGETTQPDKQPAGTVRGLPPVVSRPVQR